MIKDKLQIYLITYNREYHLKRTLEQLFCEGSPIKKCDITILDNASTDGTPELINKYCKQYPNITHIRHKVNIGGNANICRAFEMGASCGKEYVWVLCDDDYYNWNGWREVELAMNEGADCIGVARYIMSEDRQLVSPAFQMFQLTFVPAGIYKTTNITDDILTNMYDAIYSMFQQSVLAAKLINSQKKIHFIKHPIVENGLHIEDKNAPKTDYSFYRGTEATEVLFRRKEQCWVIGYANIVRLLKDENLLRECLEVSIPYKDIYGNWDNFYNCMINEYGKNAHKFHYFLEVLSVLPIQRQRELLSRYNASALFYEMGLRPSTFLDKIRKGKILEHIFSLKNTRDKKHKVLIILGLKFKIKRNTIKAMKENLKTTFGKIIRGG